ncbi:MAG: PP2C family protein-serine/threonine phosphatase [Longimicrobiales bacterium]
MKPLTERVAYHSEKGKRPSNQDAVVVGIMADGRSVAAVADGMGGRLAGDVASRRALEVITDRLREGDPLAGSVEEANRVVFEESRGNPDLHGMGTTVVALLQIGEEYTIANVGDSRAYRLGPDGISQVTADHSFTAEAAEAGEMTAEDAQLSPWANALTRAIGTDPEVEVDIYGPYDATEPHAILLCSDGFHKPLSDQGILTSVLGAERTGDMARDLASIALRAGSDDNITIAFVNFGDDSWASQALGAIQDGTDLEDRPTVEFPNSGAAEPNSPEEAPDEGPAPQWTMPVEQVATKAVAGTQRLVQSGVIGETIPPLRSKPEGLLPQGEAGTAAPEQDPTTPAAESPPERGPSFGTVVAGGATNLKRKRKQQAFRSVVLLAVVASIVIVLLQLL